MNFNKIKKLCLLIPFLFFGFGQDSLLVKIENVNFLNGTAEIWIDSPVEYSSIQFNFSGIQIENIYGGLVESMNLSNQIIFMTVTVETNNDNPIPAGNHFLFEIQFISIQNSICIYNGIIDGLEYDYQLVNDCVFQHDISWGDGWQGWNNCFEFDQSMCNTLPMCFWNSNLNSCEESDFLYWDDWENFSCEDLNMMDCMITYSCDWNIEEESCEDRYEYEDWNQEFCQSQNEWHCEYFPTCELSPEGDCNSIYFNNSENYFSHLLNGYLDEYREYEDSTGQGNISYLTIEASDDLDFGDDIGVFDLEGGYNYNDCNNEIVTYGGILVGNGEWQGGPLTIPIYGYVDDCDNSYTQLPGFIDDNQIEIHVWDESESEEYILELNRDEVYFGEEYILISNVSIQDLKMDGLYSTPNDFVLSSIYPNPFNPTTKINVEISKRNNYKLSIIDLLGNEILELHNGNLNLGNHSFEWRAKNLTSGIYFVKLISDNIVRTQKIILLK